MLKHFSHFNMLQTLLKAEEKKMKRQRGWQNGEHFHLKPLTASSMIITVFAVMTYFRFEMLLFSYFQLVTGFKPNLQNKYQFKSWWNFQHPFSHWPFCINSHVFVVNGKLFSSMLRVAVFAFTGLLLFLLFSGCEQGKCSIALSVPLPTPSCSPTEALS